ncbi:MAG: hypothetical protein ACX939_03005 [Hyphococcus sp.]
MISLLSDLWFWFGISGWLLAGVLWEGGKRVVEDREALHRIIDECGHCAAERHRSYGQR